VLIKGPHDHSPDAMNMDLGYDHAVLLLALIKLDYRPCAALFKMVIYVLLRTLRPELDGQDVEVRL
jgi:hypothetical protein